MRSPAIVFAFSESYSAWVIVPGVLELLELGQLVRGGHAGNGFVGRIGAGHHLDVAGR